MSELMCHDPVVLYSEIKLFYLAIKINSDNWLALNSL